MTALLCSCAKPPHQELDAAEYMVGKAYVMQAQEFAPAEYEAARSALADARKSMQAADYGEARDSLAFSLEHSRRAVILSKENRAKHDAAETRRLEEEEQARREAVKVAAEKAERETKPTPPPPKPAPKAKPKAKPATSYNVGDGETLWTISAQPRVYDEGMLWPLLYQANRDQIKDPRQIFPGQVLSIRRDMTPEELAEARQKARESDIFPITDATLKKQ